MAGRTLQFKPSYALAARLAEAKANYRGKYDDPLPPNVDSTSLLGPNPTQYQINCKNRVEALTNFCKEEYNVRPEDTRLVVSCLLPTSTFPVWMIYLTQRTLFWNHLNTAIMALGIKSLRNISWVRMVHPDLSMAWYQEAMETRSSEPYVFIDTNFIHSLRRWRKAIGPRNAYWMLAGECGRAEVEAPMKRHPRDGAVEEMVRLVRMAYQEKVVARPITPTPALNDLIHMIPQLSEEIHDGVPWFNCCTLLPAMHAAMFGRGEGELLDADYLQLIRVLKESIRKEARQLLHHFWVNGRTTNHTETLLSRPEIIGRMEMAKGTGDDFVEEVARCGFIKSHMTPRGKRVPKYQLTNLGEAAATFLEEKEGKWW